MYSVSDAFKNAIKNVVIEYSLEGTIGTVAFTQDNVVQGTFHISNQCTDTNEIVLGSAYIGQLEATFTGLGSYISRNDWVDKVVTPYVRVVTGENTTELIPMGIFTIKEVKHTAYGTEVKAYDNMYKFDKLLDATNFDLNAQPYDFLQIICSQCDVVLGMSRADVEDLPNGEHTMYMCGCRKETTDYASDVETYRDALFYLAQACACFATINRSGQLELRKYKQGTTDTITEAHRIAGAEFADYVTSYSGLYVESLWEGYTTFYGYDLEELQANKAEAEARKEEEEDAVEDIEADIAELVRKHNAHEITDEEYAEQRAEKDKELREAESALKMTNKYLKWVNKAIAVATAGKQGVYMDLGGNPFLQHKDSSLDPISDVTTATVLRTVILNRLSKIEYVPFSCSTVFGIHYDLGDRIMFTGGHADDDLGCLMAYDWTYNGEYVMHGFGPGSDAEANMMANVRPKADKEANRANINALNRPDLELKELGDPTDEDAQNPVALRKRKAGNTITKSVYVWTAWVASSGGVENPVWSIDEVTISMNCNFEVVLAAFPDNITTTTYVDGKWRKERHVYFHTKAFDFDHDSPPIVESVRITPVSDSGNGSLISESNVFGYNSDGKMYIYKLALFPDYHRECSYVANVETGGAIVRGFVDEDSRDIDRRFMTWADYQNNSSGIHAFWFDIPDLKQGDIILPSETEGQRMVTTLTTLLNKM